MKLNQLRYFQAVCRCGSVTAAAAKLHITQPSISASIKELEEEFGVSLFHRLGRRLSLTREGEYLLERANTLLKESDSLRENMQEKGWQKNSLRLGVPPMFGSILFPGILQNFLKHFPEGQLEIVEESSRENCQLVAKDELDMTIAILDEVDTLLFKTLPLHQSQVCYCVAANHPLAGKASVTVQEIGENPLALFREGFYHAEVIDKRFAQQGLTPHVLLRSSQLHTLYSLILSGTVGSFLFAELAAEQTGMRAIPLSPPIPIEIGLVWKRGRALHSGASRFIGLLSTPL